MTSLKSVFKNALMLEKWHGAENDFLFAEACSFLSALKHAPNDHAVSAAAIQLCHRSAGIGADGLVLWQTDTQGRVDAGIWNSDGSRAGTCGNALRCLAALAKEAGVWDGHRSQSVFELRVEQNTSANVHPAGIFATLLGCKPENTAEGTFSSRVEMGRVDTVRRLNFQQMTTLFHGNQNEILKKLFSCVMHANFVNLANPHFVLILKAETFKSFSREDFIQAGLLLQSPSVCGFFKSPLSNIGFVEVPADIEAPRNGNAPLNGIVFERGAGLTPCCGSGGCAMKVALENEKCSRPGEVESIAMPGGIIQIRYSSESLELIGPAQRVCKMTLA